MGTSAVVATIAGTTGLLSWTAMSTTPWSIAQRMREAALAMPERKKDSLLQTKAVLDVLVATGVQRPHQPASFDAMQYHRH